MTDVEKVARLTPQAQTVYRHMQVAGSISRVEAEAVYKIRQLPTPIFALRAAGIPIVTEHKRDMTGQRYGRYSLGVWI